MVKVKKEHPCIYANRLGEEVDLGSVNPMKILNDVVSQASTLPIMLWNHPSRRRRRKLDPHKRIKESLPRKMQIHPPRKALISLLRRARSYPLCRLTLLVMMFRNQISCSQRRGTDKRGQRPCYWESHHWCCKMCSGWWASSCSSEKTSYKTFSQGGILLIKWYSTGEWSWCLFRLVVAN